MRKMGGKEARILEAVITLQAALSAVLERVGAVAPLHVRVRERQEAVRKGARALLGRCGRVFVVRVD